MSVVEAELHGTDRPRRTTIFAVDNGDRVTRRAMEHFVDPLATRLPRHFPDWSIEVLAGGVASKEALGRLFEDPPAFLLTVSHGLRMTPDSELQVPFQGALVCQDWPGSGPCNPDQCFHAEDLPCDVRIEGMIAFLTACYGAGTPLEDNFLHEDLENDLAPRSSAPRALAEKPFVARLPQAMLRQGALAVVGHVDRQWTSSFCWEVNGKTEDDSAHFEEVLKGLLEGQRIGHALRPLVARWQRLAVEFVEPLKRLHQGRRVDEENLADLWTGHNDARNMILLGDPAVKNAAKDS